MKPFVLLALAVAALSFACSGDDVGDQDAVADASTKADSSGLPPPATALAVGGDYGGNGTAARIDMVELEVETNAVAGVVGGDPVMRDDGERLYVVNRSAGNVTVLDADLQLVAQIATGAVNPQDVAVAGDTIYVAALDAAGVLVLDLARPDAGVVDTLDLSELDEDGVPDCNSVQVVGDRLYASCGRIARNPPPEPWTYRGPGLVAVFDVASGEHLTTLELQHENPLGQLMATDPDGPLGGDLLVSTAPDPFGDVTRGCLQRVGTGERPAALACLVEHSELGGFASAYAEARGRLWVAVTEGFGAGRLARYEGGTWSDGGLAEGAVPVDVAACPDGQVLVADAGADSRGVHVLSRDGTLRTDAPLDVGWPETFWPSNALACW